MTADLLLAPVHHLPPPHAGEGPRRVKDPTAALRARRARRKRKALATVTAPAKQVANQPVEKSSDIKPSVTVERHAGRAITVCTTMAALALATVSAGFSITGMTAVFVGATLPVIGMGVALELGKLSAVACLGRSYGSASLRAALVALVAVLMGLNAVGAYGFLAKAHIGHAVAGETAVAGRAADIDARITVQTGILADIERRVSQIDGAVEKATAKGRTGSAMDLADQQRKTRSSLVDERRREAQTLAGMQVEKASIEGERRVAEADLGPVRYLATLLGAGDQDVLRWFILVVSLLLDPAAVLLLLAAASAGRGRQ
jgi:hypothetical protein